MSETNPVVGIMDDEIGLAREQRRRADAAEARVRDLEAQCAAMREALGDALKFIAVTPWPGNAPWTHDRLNVLFEDGHAAISGDAGRALMERVEALERDLAEKSERCSRGAHALIEIIGADGPEHIDETCARAAKRLEALERVAGAARVVKKHGYFGDDASNLDAAVDIVDALEPKR